MNNHYAPEWYEIDKNAYDWSVKLFRSVKKVLSVNLKLHAENQVEQGDIFLFNHFSRFETFIPQFLIYEQTGAYSCAIASGEFFKKETVLSKYLSHVGVFPHNHDRLFAILASHIFRGRKVIIFPEGGMVKDRSVLDERGHYSVFSRISGQRRKHHTGPAVLAQGIEAFKATVRNAYNDKNFEQLHLWQTQLKLDSMEQLLMAAIKPTLIIPSNITFYPIRSSENMLYKGAEFFSGGLNLRQTEELLIEGNLLLKDTDMDVRMGKPIDPYQVWFRGNRYLLDMVTSEFKSLDDVFSLGARPGNLKQRLLGWYFKKNAHATRDQYMAEIYQNVTINLSHLASTLIMYCISKQQREINQCLFYNTLYLAIKQLQNNKSINLHRSLLDPEQYDDLTTCRNRRFENFIAHSERTGLIKVNGDRIEFLDKLFEEYDFDTIRMENLIAVYDNEAAPIKIILQAIKKALKNADCINQDHIAELLMNDQVRRLHHSNSIFSHSRFDDVNSKETVDTNAEPFLFRPKHANGYGVLLIHGLLASPAEVIGFGKQLTEQGYTVLGVRLQGHGTSPYQLKECTWEDWYQSLKEQFRILNLLCLQSHLIGFSTGGALAMKLATEFPEQVLSITAIALPYKFIDPALMLVPLLHSTNKIIDWMSSYEGVKPFILNEPEHPDINYRHAPVRALYELRRLILEVNEILPKLNHPIFYLFADQDPIVSIESAESVMEKTASQDKTLQIIESDRHGILNENTGDNWSMIENFIQAHTSDDPAIDISKNCLSEHQD